MALNLALSIQGHFVASILLVSQSKAKKQALVELHLTIGTINVVVLYNLC